MTALHWAAVKGHLDTVRALIHAGASLNIQTDGMYGRRWAFCGGRRGRLVRSGSASAAAGAAVACRRTPLLLAAHKGHT